MSEKMKKSDKVKMSSRPKNDRLNKSDIKKQTWRAGNMLYPVPAVMVSCARKGEKPNIPLHGQELYALIRQWFRYQ